MSIQAPPGVFDILPEDAKDPWKESAKWDYVENLMRKAAAEFGYREIRTPIFEKTELFVRGVGEVTDIVSKEMYTFLDKGERSLSLRPEGTASVVRAGIENRLFDTKGQKFFYVGPMFRYERMQSGRFRQFHHFGVEAFGNPSSEQDAEIIDLAYQIYHRVGMGGLKVKLNSLGEKASREAYREALIKFLKSHEDKLSEESRHRLNKNPLRVLDSKDENDQAVLKAAPSLLDFLSNESRDHFEKVKALLTDFGIPYEIDPRLVRGLDYYQKTVFEIISEDLGAQNTLCGGGRYDGLVQSLGGPDVPSTGFAIGIERMLLVMSKQGLSFGPKKGPLLYLIPMGEAGRKFAVQFAHQLRQNQLACEVDLEGKKVGKGFARADELGAKYATVIGENELAQGTLELKELATQQKTSYPIEDIINFFKFEGVS